MAGRGQASAFSSDALHFLVLSALKPLLLEKVVEKFSFQTNSKKILCFYCCGLRLWKHLLMMLISITWKSQIHKHTDT